MKKWYRTDDIAEAKSVNLIRFLQAKHPDEIERRKDGTYVYSRRRCISIFKGRDNFYHYCDHVAKMKDDGKERYSGDSIAFLTKFIDGYNFTSACDALLAYGRGYKG